VKVFVNGKIVDEKRAVISVFDRGVLYGDGVFETMRSYKGEIAFLDRHLRRLYASAEVIGLKIEKERRYLKYIIYKLLKTNGLKDAYIRLSVTRGQGRVGLDASTANETSTILITKKFQPYPARLYKRGLKLATASGRRNKMSKAAGIKSLNYLDSILARIEAQKGGADDAILLNTKGDVAEAAVSNIFLIKGKKLVTPSVEGGIVAGITREVVLFLAAKAGLKPEERRVKPAELPKADEVFLTNTLMELMPVTVIDGKKISSGKPGKLTKLLHKLYHSRI
jgi:branched-chain amino acid aminotransferase